VAMGSIGDITHVTSRPLQVVGTVKAPRVSIADDSVGLAKCLYYISVTRTTDGRDATLSSSLNLKP
jgi:hypothetical protein